MADQLAFAKVDPTHPAALSLGSTLATIAGTLDVVRSEGAKLVAPAAAPSATQNVDGTARAVAFDAGFPALDAVLELSLAYASVGSETVTTTVTATFDDATTATATDTKTSTGTNAVVLPLSLAKSGHTITGLTVKCQSSINSSGATVTGTVLGIEAA